MKELPEVNTSFGDLYRTLYEPIRTKLLLTGIELGIFDRLSEPNEFEAVSGAIDIHPDMKGVVFDQPAVVRVAESVIRGQEMEDRMTVLGGNYMQDPIGEEYDLVWASATLNFAKQDVDLIVKKIYDALDPGGVFVSLSDGLTHEGTKPRDMTLGMVSTALMGLDMGLNQGFIAESMLRCGFQSVRSQTVDVIMGPWELDIGRKAQIPEDRR